ncbi:MAG: tetratricopeptide repeat protein [Anaerolineae bacterium]
MTEKDPPACPQQAPTARATIPWPTLAVIVGVLVTLMAAPTLFIASPPWLGVTRWVLAGALALTALGVLEWLLRRQRSSRGLVTLGGSRRRMAQTALALLLLSAFLISLWPVSQASVWVINLLTLLLVIASLWLGYHLWRSGPPAEYRRALQTYQQGHWQATLGLLDVVHAKNPEHYDAYGLRARTCRAQGHYDEARQACERMIALAPSLYHGHAELGLTLLEEGRPREAVAPLERAAAASPNLPEAHFNLGMAHVEAGEPSQATEVLTRALRLGLRDEVTQLIARFHLWQSWQELDCEGPAREALKQLQRLTPVLKRWQRELNESGVPAADRRRDQALLTQIDEALAGADAHNV